MSTEKHNDDSREIVAVGIAVCLILLGFGGCCALTGGFHAEFKDAPVSTAK